MPVVIKPKVPGAVPAVAKSSEFDSHLQGGSAVAETVIEKKTGKTEYQQVLEKTEEVATGLIVPAHDKVELEIGAGKTINLGNYESARISVNLRVPCSKDTLEDTFNFAKGWVDAKMAAMLDGNEKESL